MPVPSLEQPPVGCGREGRARKACIATHLQG